MSDQTERPTMTHHGKCPKALAWDIPNVPCECPRGWPRKEKPMPDTPTPRRFDLGDVLSVTTGILMSPRLVDGVYDILNYMTGDNLFTHQLPRASRQVEPVILAQHPQLKAITLDAMKPKDVRVTLARLKRTYGETLALVPMKDYVAMNPIEEILKMRGQDA